VYQLKRDFPELTIVINGGISAADEVHRHLRHADGVMLGRAAYHDPYLLAVLERDLFGTPLPDREAVILQMRPYIESHLAAGGRLQHISRHLLGLFQGLPGARAWRRTLSENAHRPDADMATVEAALRACGGNARDQAA
jgi:tRNA-dihydrouridine synthase A